MLDAALAQQPELDELADHAPDARLVETGLLRDRRPRAGPMLDDEAKDRAEVVITDGTRRIELEVRG